jgi:hypothetical protein
MPDGPHMAMSFNLCSTAFVDCILADAATLVNGRAPAFVEGALSAWKQRPRATVNVTMARNNREMLARCNRRVIEQCRERGVLCGEDRARGGVDRLVITLTMTLLARPISRWRSRG